MVFTAFFPEFCSAVCLLSISLSLNLSYFTHNYIIFFPNVNSQYRFCNTNDKKIL